MQAAAMPKANAAAMQARKASAMWIIGVFLSEG